MGKGSMGAFINPTKGRVTHVPPTSTGSSFTLHGLQGGTISSTRVPEVQHVQHTAGRINAGRGHILTISAGPVDREHTGTSRDLPPAVGSLGQTMESMGQTMGSMGQTMGSMGQTMGSMGQTRSFHCSACDVIQWRPQSSARVTPFHFSVDRVWLSRIAVG